MLERVYKRLGIVYFVPLMVLAFVVNVVDVGSFTIIGLRYFDAPDETRAGIVRTAIIGSNVSLLITFGLMFILLRHTFAWMNGDRTPERAPAAWYGITNGVPRLIYTGVVLVLIGDSPAIFAVSRIEGLDVWVLLLILAAAGAATLAGGLIILVGAESWMRPVVDEIGGFLDDFQPGRGRRPFARRLIVFILLVSFLSPFYTVGVVGSRPSGAARVAGTVTVTSAIALTFGLLVSLAVARSITYPVSALVGATRRVRRGELDVELVPGSNDEIGELIRSFNEMVDGLKEREELHSALGTYVDPVVADRLLREGQVLEGQELEATVMFVDIVSYTSRVENMQPPEVVAELNTFFQLLLPIVNAHGGHTNKLLGDGFMAVFGAPVVLDDHADRALSAAVEMQAALDGRYSGAFRAGIGLNSGSVVVGTTGGSSKLDFTVIGDTVNVASRVEGLTRETGDGIILTEETKDRLKRTDYALVPRGQATVKGRAAPVQTYAALTSRPD